MRYVLIILLRKSRIASLKNHYAPTHPYLQIQSENEEMKSEAESEASSCLVTPGRDWGQDVRQETKDEAPRRRRPR